MKPYCAEKIVSGQRRGGRQMIERVPVDIDQFHLKIPEKGQEVLLVREADPEPVKRDIKVRELIGNDTRKNDTGKLTQERQFQV